MRIRTADASLAPTARWIGPETGAGGGMVSFLRQSGGVARMRLRVLACLSTALLMCAPALATAQTR